MAGSVPDETEPKVVAEASGQRKMDSDDDGQCHCQSEDNTTETARQTGVYRHHHQCAHTGSLLDDEHTLHQPKQEERDRNRQIPPFHTGSSVEEEDHDHIACSDTLDRSRSRDGDTCSAADKTLGCSASRVFWKGIESTECCKKVWGHFKEKLKQVFPRDPALEHGRVMHLLKALLEVNVSTDFVQISNYLNLIKFFGPFRSEDNRCVVLQQLLDLVTKSNSKDPKNRRKKVCWFAGPMTRGAAETKLKGKAPETFLIRMSDTEKEEGNFALSLVMTDGTIEHFRLKGNPDEAIRSSLCLEFRGRKFSSLPNLVNDYLRVEFEEKADEDSDNVTRCKTVCPDLPFNHIINSYTE